jgi:hypothetical protein
MTPAQYRRWRFYAESLIEQAITILDTIDGDADLEDGGDGSPSPPPQWVGTAKRLTLGRHSRLRDSMTLSGRCLGRLHRHGCAEPRSYLACVILHGRQQ